MNTLRKVMVILILAGLALTACQPQEVVKTVEVPVEVTKIVEGETVVEVVTATPEPPEEEQIVLRFANWATAEEATRDIFLKAIDEFKATHPNVEIELIALPFDQVRPQLITMSAGGNPPDIVQLNGANSPPKTMDELNEVMATLKANLPEDVYPIGVDTTKIDYALTGFWPWMLTEGARPLYNGNYDFTDPATVKAFEWLNMIAEEGYTPLGLQIKEERELMAKGKIAMKLDGPYVAGIMRSLNPEFEGDALYETFGLTSVPVGDLGQPVTLADLHQIGISTQCKYPEIAWEFIEFFNTNDVALEEYTMTSGLVPALKSEVEKYNGTPYLDNPISQAFINEVIPSMIGGPYDATYGSASQFIIQGMQEVAISGVPVETALEDVTTNMKVLYGVE